MPFCGNACAFPPRPLRWRKPVVLSAECIIFAFPNLTNPATDVRVRFIRFLCLVALVSLCACRVTKFVPDGSYLLDKVTIETEGREVRKDELQKYVRQAPNSSVFGIWRMQLRLYSLAGRDTARWHNRLLMRMGAEARSSTDKSLLRHTINAVYRRESPCVQRVLRAIRARHMID